MTLAAIARQWQLAGVSVIPILANQTKRPAVEWREYQAHVPTLDEILEWWSNGHAFGIALICGSVSGNLEMCEIEGRAMDNFTSIHEACDRLGAGDILGRLMQEYSQESPTGGLHLLYRVTDHPVPGNTKIARNVDGEVLAETRGEGGYVIGAPSPGACHPSGKPWVLTSGAYGTLPSVSWAERCLLHEAIRQALNSERLSAPTQALAPRVVSPSPVADRGAGVRPGDDFEAQTSWQDILIPHGWTIEHEGRTETHWTRPGKRPSEGSSATTGYAGDRDRLFVFSTSTVFPTETPITKFRAYSILNHGGNDSLAARTLADRGFGTRSTPTLLPDFEPNLDRDDPFSLDDVGNAQRLWSRVRGRFVYHHEEGAVFHWDGRTWVQDIGGALTREAIVMTDQMMAEGRRAGDDSLAKWAKSSRSAAKMNGMVNLFPRIDSEATKGSKDFNVSRHLLNVQNGVLNLRTRELVAHDPSFMMTRLLGAAYRPEAKCPRFTEFMESALPDPELRSYVQRALGYSLLGDTDQRAMFMIYGPSGTGKSTLMETIRAVFGEYGTTAAPGAFRERRESAPTNDLHNLRARRFVTTSETAETTNFNEDLLKRLTGRDSITSRELYQRNQEWVPECVLWLATNHPPKFTSDDDAIWRRAKLIPFLTQFLGAGQVMDMARQHLIPEADGILNWLLEGLSDYLANGLMEPDEVTATAEDVRRQTDSALRFLEEKVDDGTLEPGEHKKIKMGELFNMYTEWARRNGERHLGSRRFNNRIQAFAHLDSVTESGQTYWSGLARSPRAGVLGTTPLWGLQDGH
jgi:putative DNA primase/helicase